jgi:hypothetical protein
MSVSGLEEYRALATIANARPLPIVPPAVAGAWAGADNGVAVEATV